MTTSKHFNNKKTLKNILFFTCLRIFSFLININNSESYYFGLKSADDTPENIEAIEKTYGVNIPIVSFIFDPRNENDVINSIDHIIEKLGTDRIYHITISPDMYSANDVVLGKFDKQYTAFFKKVKEKNLHVIFRTMHEMNGGRYPRSSNPEKFKAAWIHVRTLSRTIGLSEKNILFDFSVNHRDMPTKGTPSQSAPLIQCNPGKTNCYHFEDYYPGDEFVDVIGFTFYNRGKAMGNRQRLSPTQILYDPNWNTYERIKSFKKPIVIDEVATTSVRYNGEYNFEKSRNEYLTHNERKDYRIHQLREFLVNHPEISAAIYFNTDYTHGLSFKVVGEADRAIINIDENKVYGGFHELETFSEKKLDNILSNLFHLEKFEIEGKTIFIDQKCKKEINTIYGILNDKAKTTDEKIKYINEIKKANIKSYCVTQSLNILANIYNDTKKDITLQQ